MATYDIDKITLPSGDVCNLTIPDASLTEVGKVTTGTQKFGGQKVFDKFLSINYSSGTGYPILYFRDEVHHPVDEVGGYASAAMFNATRDITQNRLGFALWSPKSDGTGYTTKSESFTFPVVDVGRTTNGAYRILTTKNPNDVPTEVIEGNLVINGGPIVSFHTSSNQYSPANWTVFVGNPVLFSTWSMDNMHFEFDITTASSSDNNYFQLQKMLSRETTHPGYFGGVKCEDFQDGEKVTLSFEYISPYTLKYVPRLYIKPTSTSETYNCFASSNTDNPVTLAATNTWSRVSYTGTVSDGWSSAINTLLEQKYANSFYFIFNFCPQGTGVMKIRNIQINRGEVATKYTHNPLDYLFNVGSGANYLGSREGAIIKNNGNFTATGEGQIYPIIGGKSQTGFWSNGTCADKYQFVYLTDANYTARNNYAEVYSLPAPDSSVSEIKQYDILTTKNAGELSGLTSSHTIKASKMYAVPIGNYCRIVEVNAVITLTSAVSNGSKILDRIPVPLTSAGWWFKPLRGSNAAGTGYELKYGADSGDTYGNVQSAQSIASGTQLRIQFVYFAKP